MANTNTTTLNDLLPSIVSEAMFIAQENSIMRNLVKNYSVALGTGKTVTVPIYAPEVAAAVAEDADLVAAATSTSSAVLTVSEVGISKMITDLSVQTAASNVIADIGRLVGNAIATKMDKDLGALLAAFSVTIGAGGTLSAAMIFEAVAKLRAAGVPTDLLFCVLNPEVAYDLKSGVAAGFVDPNPGLIQNEAMATGYVTRIAGVPVFESANVATGAVYHRDALGLALLQDINIETERNASARATELVATATYGVGEILDAYGRTLNVVSTIA